ncbi:MAG: hypothetical protein IIW94_02845 [Clostridia bacterium]|nr:hypothetical protein [Clostridia bacterium]
MEPLLLKPYDYFEAIQSRYNLLRRYPFISAHTIGKSVMGREITAFIIGKTDEYSLFVGGIHGNAHFTSTYLYTFLGEVCEAFLNDGVIEGLKVRRAFDGRGLIVIPCLNPDGCEIAANGNSALHGVPISAARLAKKDCSAFTLNARGSDINKVFCTHPHTEPESNALLTLAENGNIRHLIVFDKGDNKIVLPNSTSMPKRSGRMAEIMLSCSALGMACGSKEVWPEGIAEWFLQKYFKPSFTVLLDPKGDCQNGYRSVRELLTLCAIM